MPLVDREEGKQGNRRERELPLLHLHLHLLHCTGCLRWLQAHLHSFTDMGHRQAMFLLSCPFLCLFISYQYFCLPVSSPSSCLLVWAAFCVLELGGNGSDRVAFSSLPGAWETAAVCGAGRRRGASTYVEEGPGVVCSSQGDQGEMV